MIRTSGERLLRHAGGRIPARGSITGTATSIILHSGTTPRAFSQRSHKPIGALMPGSRFGRLDACRASLLFVKLQCLLDVRLGQAELPRDPRGSDASLKSCKDGVQLPT